MKSIIRIILFIIAGFLILGAIASLIEASYLGIIFCVFGAYILIFLGNFIYKK